MVDQRSEILSSREEENPELAHVLLAEDDKSLREMYGLVFGGLVPEAGVFDSFQMVGSGQEALEVFKANPDHFNVLITDYDMPPGINGSELAKEIKELSNGRVLTVLLSARVDDSFSERPPEFDLVLPKRFSIKDVPDIASKIRAGMTKATAA